MLTNATEYLKTQGNNLYDSAGNLYTRLYDASGRLYHQAVDKAYGAKETSQIKADQLMEKAVDAKNAAVERDKEMVAEASKKADIAREHIAEKIQPK